MQKAHSFYKGVPLIKGDESSDALFSLILESIAEVSMEIMYVLDFHTQGFIFVDRRDTFLCGCSVEEVMSLGYDFFTKVIHSEDLPLFNDIHAVILQRLHNMNNSGDINYFSFSVRAKNGTRYIMINHKLKPVFINGRIHFGIFLLTSSVFKDSGHLRIHYKNGIDSDEYLFDSQKWQKITLEPLTMREKTILKLVKQGKTYKEIASEICISLNTLRNERESIYLKLNVNTMVQAVFYATTNNLIFDHKVQEPIELQNKKVSQKMDFDKLNRIQEKIHKGQSLNSIAREENINEGTIRYAIKTGKLKKSNS